MKEIAREWLEYAKCDLQNAVILFDNKSYKDSIWYCHQAIEKILKAIIANKGMRVKKVHDLVELLEETGSAASNSISEFVAELNPHYIPTRYPEATFSLKVVYGKKESQNILHTTQEVFKWLKTTLDHGK